MTMLSDGMLLGAGSALMAFLSSASAAVSTGTDLTINKPTGVQSGDYLLAIVWDSSALTVLTSAGWSPLASNFTGAGRFALLEKRAGGSEPSSYTFTSGSVAKNGSVLAFRNVPISGGAQTIGTATAVSATTSTAAAISPPQPGILLGLYGIVAGGRVVTTPPSGMTQIAFENTALASTVYMLAASPSGNSGAKVLVWDGSSVVTNSFLVQIY